MYQGRTAAEKGLVFGTSLCYVTIRFYCSEDYGADEQCSETGHENMGIAQEIGEGVTLLKKGDRIVLPFNVADGRCQNCEEGKTAFCTGVNPGFVGGAYGYVAMGPYQGGQVRRPETSFLISLGSELMSLCACRHNISASPTPTSTPSNSRRAPSTKPTSPSWPTSSLPVGTDSCSQASSPVSLSLSLARVL